MGVLFGAFNGGVLNDFRPSCGLRQEDPISPYLFVIAAEGLPCLQKNGIRGIMVAPTAPEVNHLLFADDSLLFFEASNDEARRVRDLLQVYCNASGQKINADKSSIYFNKGVPNSLRGEIKETLAVHTESLSEKYLGLPTPHGRISKGHF